MEKVLLVQKMGNLNQFKDYMVLRNVQKILKNFVLNRKFVKIIVTEEELA